MRIAMLSPISSRTPPWRHGPWEDMVSHLVDGLIEQGIDVTLFASGDLETEGLLHAVCESWFEEERPFDARACECHHISELSEQAGAFDLIHNHIDFLPLIYTGLIERPVVSTIHRFPSRRILPVYKKYNGKVFYVAISDSHRSSELDYMATIHYGINTEQFHFQASPEDYLLFFGRIHPDRGTKEAIEIARACNKRLIIVGFIQDEEYYQRHVQPCIDNHTVVYAGSADPGEKERLLGNAYALLHPIQFNDPFSLAAIESMACGTPVIAFNKGCMGELIEDGENGFLVNDTEEAIKAVHHIGEIARSSCRASVKERFTVDQMTEKYIHVYKQVLSLKKQEDHRPWGYYSVLSEAATYKAKRIVVLPGKRLSLQRHKRRAEHWFILQGTARVTLNGDQFILGEGESKDISRGAIHRIENIGDDDLSFIEVQTGDYFGEDDIDRIEDDFGRA